MPGHLLILGASVRAAAQSAVRAGISPIGSDLFCDEDLRAACAAVRVTNYPSGLIEVADAATAGPWMYTGALENFPDIVDRISQDRPLYGNRGEVLARVRNPGLVHAALTAAGLPAPRCADSPADLPIDGSWLRKPYHSAGGSHISPWHGQDSTTDRKWCFQQRVEGLPCAALFVAAARQAVFLGATRQLVGTEWSGARAWQYAGSIGPLRLTAQMQDSLQRIGQCLSQAFDLVGLFGVDAILAGETAWPIEVNPRYTASVEVLERALGIHALRLHVDACRTATLPHDVPSRPSTDAGKAIVYARREMVVSPELNQFIHDSNEGCQWPIFADIPAQGEHIKAHHPVVSVLSSGETEDQVEAELKNAVLRIEQLANH